MSARRVLPPRIELLVADVDGTLVTDDKRLTSGAQAAVRALERAGIAFAIVSSRPPFGVRMLIEPLAIRTPLAAFNGGLIVSPEGLVPMEGHPLPAAIARRAVARIQRASA